MIGREGLGILFEQWRWPDQRAAINGKKKQYEHFFRAAERVVEEIGGASANRHGAQRVLTEQHSGQVSIPSLYERICQEMDASGNREMQLAPSMQLLRISLCPSNQWREVAKYYTGSLLLTRGMDRAVMRKKNPDSHYNDKLNKNTNHFLFEINREVDKLKGFAVDFGGDHHNRILFSRGAAKISVDDKAAVPLGEPGCPVRSNVRPMSRALVESSQATAASSMDHDIHSSNVRSSFVLFMKPPEEDGQSCRKGRVSVTIKDGATQNSTAMRHSIEIQQQLQLQLQLERKLLGLDVSVETCLPFVVAIRSDGGSDRNPKNASVQVSMVQLFNQLDVDILLVLVTACDVSHVNEVEGVMPVATLA